jgi:hypothetical protein
MRKEGFELKQGIVMELQGGKATIMTSAGEFIEVKQAKSGWAIGDEIQFTPQSTIPWSWSTRWTAAVAAIFLVAMVGIPWFNLGTSQAVAAYVTLDINPSIEFSVTTDEKVIAAEPLNEDGRRLLLDIDVEGLDLAEATILAVREAEKQGYLSSDGDVVITTILIGENQQVERSIRTHVSEAMENNSTSAGTKVQTTIVHATPELREEAKKEKLTPGQYALYLTAVNSGVEISAQSFQEKSIHLLAKEHDGLRQIMDKGIQKEVLTQLVGKGKGKEKDKGKGKGRPNSEQEEINVTQVEPSEVDDDDEDDREDLDEDKESNDRPKEKPGNGKGKQNKPDKKDDEDEDEEKITEVISIQVPVFPFQIIVPGNPKNKDDHSSKGKRPGDDDNKGRKGKPKDRGHDKDGDEDEEDAEDDDHDAEDDDNN